MTPDVQQWVDKAEGDWRTAGRELRARARPNYDAACFHAQQAAEKYLKALLLARQIGFPRIHDLVELLALLGGVPEALVELRDDAIVLTQYAVFFRYPGRWANKSQARAALEACSRIRERTRAALRVQKSNSGNANRKAAAKPSRRGQGNRRER